MFFFKTIEWFFALALALLSAQSLADSFDNQYEEKPWAEIEVQLPAFPEKADLIPFQVGAITDTKYLIDGNSLSVGSDGVLRYTLIVISSAGAQNISYEGLRCATAERRFYAFGRSDKTWSKARRNQWVKIQGDSNNHHVELYANYFCSVGTALIKNADDARRALRYGGKPLAARP
ncbi:CNP1-like family protein [Propionivibrio sp.]|uniref:CNP1-like family protein n=1 Tax=Propionivibrio sp. TaxID=2212460 RepID=UPI003BF01DCB